jgi:uncharacterized protein (DUF952 family)
LANTSERIYLIVLAAADAEIAARDEYTAPSLATEGFLHASGSVDQLLRVANRKFSGEPRLAVLCVDPARVVSEVRYEQGRDPAPFPHIYGPLNGNAIVELKELRRGPEGRFATL